MLVLSVVFAVVLPTTWIVDASNGPGTNFTDLPAAVAAAGSGDTILVRPGTYSHFNVTGKALTIRGAGAASTMVTMPPPAGSAYPTTTVEGVPSGSTFYMSALKFVGGYSTPVPVFPGLRVGGVTTRVVLADVVAIGVQCCILFGTPGLYVDGAAAVHATRSQFTGTLGYSEGGGHGAVVLNGSLLAADACTLTGGGAGGGFQPFSGAGVFAHGGVVLLSNSSAIGGNASLGFGGYGIAVLNGFARVTGTGANLVKGGTGSGAPAGYSIFADTNASAIVHGSVSLQGPTSGAVTTGAPPLPYLSVSGAVTAAGELQAAQPATLTIAGSIPGAPFVFLVDLNPAFSAAFAPVTLGELLVPVPLVIPFEGTLGATGTFQLSFTPAAALPAFLDVPLYAQVGVLDAVAGQIRLSNGWIRIFKS